MREREREREEIHNLMKLILPIRAIADLLPFILGFNILAKSVSFSPYIYRVGTFFSYF